jgi:hypothetical protein
MAQNQADSNVIKQLELDDCRFSVFRDGENLGNNSLLLRSQQNFFVNDMLTIQPCFCLLGFNVCLFVKSVIFKLFTHISWMVSTPFGVRQLTRKRVLVHFCIGRTIMGNAAICWNGRIRDRSGECGIIGVNCDSGFAVNTIGCVNSSLTNTNIFQSITNFSTVSDIVRRNSAQSCIPGVRHREGNSSDVLVDDINRSFDGLRGGSRVHFNRIIRTRF